MRYQEIKTGVELNEALTPQRFSADLLLQHSIPWVIGLTIFCITIHLTLHLFYIWEYAPLFYVTGFLASLILSLLSIIIGLIVLMFSGSFFVFKNIPDIFSVVAYQTYTALILASFFMIYIKNLLKKIHLSRNLNVALLFIPVITFLYLASANSPAYPTYWVNTVIGLITSQFSKH